MAEPKNQVCTNESAYILTEKCLADSKEMAVKYLDLTKEYYKCSTAKIQVKFTQAGYIEIIKIGIEEQKQKLLPIFPSCLSDNQNNVKKHN